MNPPRNRKGASVCPPPNANASELYPNQMRPSGILMAQRKLNKVLNGVAIAAGVVFVVAVGHFGSYFGIFLTIAAFVVFIACLILPHLLGSDEDAGFWPKNP